MGQYNFNTKDKGQPMAALFSREGKESIRLDKNRWGLDKSQRMQLKTLICFLGLLLILILLFGHLLIALLHNNENQKKPEHVPVVEVLRNVWLMEADSEGVVLFRDGTEEKYVYGSVTLTEGISDQLADVELTDGVVSRITVKANKINGKVLGADETCVEIEGYGKLPLSADYKGYRIYNTLAMCTGRDLSFGYAYADFVMEEGEICGILMVKEDAMDSIRVLIKTSDYAQLLHNEVVLTADTDFTIAYGSYDAQKVNECTVGQEITITQDSPFFEGDRITITPKALTGRIQLKNVARSQGVPSYRGHIELIKTNDGIAVINQVLLEEYLYSVVPSEMPSRYPKEALKAQVVCARTYAYGKMLMAGYPQYGAHVDDSTSYQVYNNVLEQESTTTAVKETYGQLLYTADKKPAQTYYYSTSCGVGSDATVWKTTAAGTLTYLQEKLINKESMVGHVSAQGELSWQEELMSSLQDENNFKAFITAKNASDFEVTEGWYRWNYQVNELDVDYIYDVLKKRYQANNELVLTYDGSDYISAELKDFSKIKDMYVAKRGGGGIADELIIETDNGIYKVISEYNIRCVLNNGVSKVLRQDGSEVSSPTLLPSAFFVITPSREKEKVVGYTLQGGGFGHGVGMSQNAAKSMAEQGYTSDEILNFFYDNCYIQSVYNE